MMKHSAKSAIDFPAVLRKLKMQGVRAEHIAYHLDVSFATVMRWMNGTRKPKTATLQQIEHVYGVKIL